MNKIVNSKKNLIYLYALIFPISGALSNIILGLLIILSIIENHFKEKLNIIKNNKLVWIIYAIPFLIFISTLFSPTSSNGFFMNSGIDNEYEFIFKHFIWLNFLFLILITSNFDIQQTIKMFLIGMFFSEIISYSIFFHIIDLNYFKNLGLLTQKSSYNDPSPFMHHSFYSIYLAVSIILILDNLDKFKNIYKLISIIFLLSATTNLFLNGGRVGQIAFFIGIILYIYKKFGNIKIISITTLILFLIFITAFNFSPIFKSRINLAYDDINKVISEKNFGSSWGQRIAADITTIKIMIHNPKYIIFGFGAGNAKEIFFKKGKENAPNEIKYLNGYSHLHNQFLQLWVDGSIISLILIILFFYFLYKCNPSPLTLGFIGIISFSFIADVMWYRPQTYVLILFISAILCKLNQNQKEAKYA